MNAFDRIKGPIFELFDYIAGKSSLEYVIISFFATLVVLLLVFPLRECAKGYVAKWLGDDTAEREGRLTLNPLEHIDLSGALCMMLVSFGWTKHIPVNINRCHKVKSGRTALVLISLAGPLALIIMAYVFTIIYKVLYLVGDSDTMYLIAFAVSYTAQLCVQLAVLFLLPIPFFDGYMILAGFLPKKWVYFVEQNAQIISWICFMLLVFGVFDIPITIGTIGLLTVLDLLSFFVGM